MSRTGEVYETSRFRALGHDFVVTVPDATVGRYVEEVLAALAAPGSPSTRYDLRQRNAGDHWQYVLTFEGTEFATAVSPSVALSNLLWHINQETVRRSSARFVLLHAAAAERDGAAVVLPAAMESGKTTLVAGLVKAGLRYLSDEIAAFDPDGQLVLPYPKPLSVDPGSWPVLADLRPQVSNGLTGFLERQWQIPPTAISPIAVGEPAVPRVLVLPRYEAGAPTVLTPLGRAEALVQVLHCAFTFPERGERDVRALAALVRQCACYRLVMSDLDTASKLVLDRLAEFTA